MLREIRVYGQLAKFLGRRTFKAAVSNAAEAIRFLIANFPQLEKHMADRYYKIIVGNYDISFNELHDPSGQQVIKIIPVIGGAGGDATTNILIGVGIAALSFGIGAAFSAGVSLGGLAGIGTVGTIGVAIGASLVLGGVSQLLTPAETISPIGVDTLSGTDTGTEGTVLDPQENYSFSGIQNTSRPGVPLPICYGEIIVGSIVISTGTDTVQEAV
jgi:predicted phage tail protein